MIVYGTHTNLNIWKPIVCGDNQNLYVVKANPVVNRYFLPIFTQPQKITGILGKTPPLNCELSFVISDNHNNMKYCEYLKTAV
jgi:hypothetical protein